MRGIPEGDLAKTAQKAEGLEGEQNGATVRPRYRRRDIHCYAVTASELKQIGLSNLLTSAFFGVGSGLLAFALDVDKDLYLASGTPNDAATMAETVSTICWVVGLACWIISGLVLFWRRDIIKQIKEETEEPKS